MENDRSSDVLTPVTGETRTEVMRSGVMGKVDALRSRGTELMHRMQHSMTETTHAFRDRSSRVKPMIHDAMDKAERELHSNPAKWAGIAAGASFVLGMIGREIRHRASLRARRGLPDLIIIETA